ncbi:MAG: carbohydrate ABC transporter substrate-binding protein [Thermotogaceae bacterium]|nr:carbohydrate ABC transporter substrate-binding protein [Thermotogaceae bacterium]
MRKFVVVSLLVLALFIFAKSLTVIGPWSGAEQEKFMPVLKAFEEKYGIDVEYRVYRAEDLAKILPAQFGARRAPGDVIFMWGWFIAEQGKKGHVVDLLEYISPEDFLPGVLDSVTVDGKLYGVSYTGKVKPGFWYRKSFFKKYGLKVPETWKDFVNLLEKIKKMPGIKAPIASGDGVGWPLSDVTEHFIITFGGPTVQKDLAAKNIKFESFTVRRAFEKLAFLLEKGYFSEPTEWTTILKQWWNEEYGLYFMGSWITGMVDDPEDLGVFTLPGAEGVVFASDYFFVPKYASNLEDAIKLAKFLATEGQIIQVKQGGHIATYKGVPLSAYPTVDREVARIMQNVEVVSDLDDTVGGAFQKAFWDQLKLLWVRPERLDEVLQVLDEKMGW